MLIISLKYVLCGKWSKTKLVPGHRMLNEHKKIYICIIKNNN